MPPVEGPLLVVLPEPAVPVLPSPEPKPQAASLATEPVPEVIAQASPVPPAVAQPLTPPAPPPVAPPAVPPPSPAPPAAVTPSLPVAESDSEPSAEISPEEEIPSPSVREPVPLPVRPVPEPPAAIPPVVRKEEGIVFSRIVRATVGQLVEIPFRGEGWVYLGELGSRRGISYDSRRLDFEGQSFIFQAEAAGTYALNFYKEDFVRDYILNDHVQVIIGEAPEISLTGYFNPVLDRGRVVAEPRWPTVAEEAEAFRRDRGSPAAAPAPAAIPVPAMPATEGQPSQAEGGQAAEPVSALPPTPSAQDTAPLQKLEADQYLTRAREEFDAGRVAAAIGFLDQFREQYPSGSDEAYWLYGQFYEANSPSRDIRLSLDYYRRLVREYPQSSRYNDARRRIAYLERYYINIQ
ncbi:hypothetical protein FACS1894110_23120 [Spirochaetia bacterium]|nr:hypothetical protein FACS1894110_23120 [Spirochaetia bacterium]